MQRRPPQPEPEEPEGEGEGQGAVRGRPGMMPALAFVAALATVAAFVVLA